MQGGDSLMLLGAQVYQVLREAMVADNLDVSEADMHAWHGAYTLSLWSRGSPTRWMSVNSAPRRRTIA